MSNNKTPERVAGKLQGIILLLPAILAVMAIVALAPTLPQLQAAFADAPGAKWLVPIVLTIPAICLIFFAPLAGYLGDRVGRRKLLIASLLIYSLVGLAPLVLNDLTHILISRFLVGVAEAFALTLSTIMISDYFSGTERDKWLGYQTGVASISAIFLVVIGGALGRFGWRGPFAIYAVPLVFMLLIIFFTWEPKQQHKELQRSVAKVAFPWPIMLRICLVTLFASVAFYIAQVQNGVVLEAVNIQDPARRGMLQAIAAMGTVAGTILFRFISTWHISRLLMIGFGCVGLGYLYIGNSSDGTAVTVGMTLAQFGCGVLLPSLLTWAVKSLPYEVRGRGTGLWQGVFSFGQFVCTPLFTLAADRTGGILGAFNFYGILNFVIAVLALLLIVKAARSTAANSTTA